MTLDFFNNHYHIDPNIICSGLIQCNNIASVRKHVQKISTDPTHYVHTTFSKNFDLAGSSSQ